MRRPEVSRLPAGMLADSGRGQVRDRDAETVTEIPGGCVNAQIVDGGPQVELRSRRVATEAAEAMAAEMDREDPALRTGSRRGLGMGREARTAAGCGHEAQQVQHLLDGDLAADLPQIDSRHELRRRSLLLGPNREEAQVFMASVGEAAWPLCHPCWARAA